MASGRSRIARKVRAEKSLKTAQKRTLNKKEIADALDQHYAEEQRDVGEQHYADEQVDTSA